MFCISALLNAVVFGVGFSSMKTGISISFLGLATVSAGNVAFVFVKCKTKLTTLYKLICLFPFILSALKRRFTP